MMLLTVDTNQIALLGEEPLAHSSRNKILTIALEVVLKLRF